jgi:hypothetical protein
MAVKVKSLILWRREVENRPGALAETLAPLAKAGANLQVVMGYRHPGEEGRATIELYPVAGKRSTAGARQAGLSASSTPTLLVEGDNRPGLGHAIARALANNGANAAFLVTQVIAKKYSAVIGFESETDAKRAAGLIKKLKATRK